MVSKLFVIDGYRLWVNNRPSGPGSTRAINLRGRDSGGRPHTATVAFFAGEPDPQVRVLSNGSMFAKHPLSDWDAIVDILRNEKPVTFRGDEPDFSQFYTGSEPVGEEES